MLLILEILVTLALCTSLLVLPYILKSVETERISLKDVEENPSRYLGERDVTLTLARVERREDPYHRLAEQYYLVYVRDEEGYEMPFVISGEEEPRYRAEVASEAVFALSGSIGPQLIQPPDRLITNILFSIRADPYSREYYRVSIRLIGPTDGRPSQLNIAFTYLIVSSTSATIVTLGVLLAMKRREN